MIDKNKLNRIKGILSAKNGTEIPKFQNPAQPIYAPYNHNDPDFIKFVLGVSDSSHSPMFWAHYLKLKTAYPEASTDDLISYMNGSTPLPNGAKVSDVLKDNTKSVMEVPGQPDIDPNTAVENASEINEILYKQAQFNDVNVQNAMILGLQNTSLNDPPLTIKTGEELLKSAGLNASDLQKEALEKAKNLSLPINALTRGSIGNNIGLVASQAIQGIGNAIGALLSATDSNTTKTLDSVYGSAANIASLFGPIGQAVGGAMKIAEATGNIIQSLGGGTDLQTTADKWMDSAFFSWNIGMLNGFLGKNSDKFSMDLDTIEKVGSSYGGSVDTISDAAQKANKKYGLFSNRARKKANEKINLARTLQNTMTDIADDATEQRLSVSSMGEQAGLAYSMMVNGGYDLKYTYAAKHGGMLEWNPIITLEWEPTVELNWELPVFKEGGNVEFVEELEWIPEFNSGNKIRTIEELIEYAKKKNPRFILRLSEEPRGIKFKDDEGNDSEGSHYLESRGKYVIQRIQEINGELKFLNPQEAINRAVESGNYLEMSPEEAIIFAEQYKQGWPEFFKKFKKGGSLYDSDVPEIEETVQKNVIPEGALHKNKHHMEHAEGLTKKGIPVIDEDGEQQAEIEHSEIIFTLEVTKKLEEYYKIFYSEETSNKEKELAALDAGKLLVYLILENTEDRTGLIDSCKKGGSLTLKKSTEDLIEEALEWMPTITMIEEVIEDVKEEKIKLVEKTKKKSEKELMKEAIKEVLIELLTK